MCEKKRQRDRVRERARERDRETEWVRVRERETERETERVRQRESECVCVWKRERLKERERESEREREREKDWERECEREREIERERECVSRVWLPENRDISHGTPWRRVMLGEMCECNKGPKIWIGNKNRIGRADRGWLKTYCFLSASQDPCCIHTVLSPWLNVMASEPWLVSVVDYNLIIPNLSLRTLIAFTQFFEHNSTYWHLVPYIYVCI